MKCLEYRRIALSDPQNGAEDFLQHQSECEDCANYLKSVKQMDDELRDSLQVSMPEDLMARLKLANEMAEQDRIQRSTRRYALVASVAIALFVSALFVTGQFNIQQSLSGDYEQLISAVMEHADEKMTPVWNADRANQNVQALMASYDDNVKFKHMSNLRFSRICPMGRYRGLHATMQTDEGQVTFAYIKGQSVGELLDASYQGYMTRVKPVKGGNIIIISRTDSGLERVDKEVTEALYWDI